LLSQFDKSITKGIMFFLIRGNPEVKGDEAMLKEHHFDATRLVLISNFITKQQKHTCAFPLLFILTLDRTLVL
jgi:hypothetical protein